MEATTNDLNTELNNYKTNVKGFDSNALYMMYMGGNDLADITLEFQFDLNDLITERGITFNDVMTVLENGSLTLQAFPVVATQLSASSENAGQFIKNIADGGAKYIVVLNHFNEFYRQTGHIG